MARKRFWKEMIQKASRIDYGEPLPKLDEKFLSVWSSHYAHISSLTSVKPPVLEIGAGFGVLAAGLAEIGACHVWATEHPSRAYLFKTEYREFMQQNQVGIVAHDLARGLPFAEGVFSQIYCCDVLEHLWFEDGLLLLKEILRVLRPDGELILSTPNLNRLANVFRFALGYSINPPYEAVRCGDTLGHVREFAPKELRAVLSRSGFEILRVRYGLNPYFTADAFAHDNIFSPVATSFTNGLTRMISLFFAGLGDEIYVLARRPRKGHA